MGPGWVGAEPAVSVDGLRAGRGWKDVGIWSLSQSGGRGNVGEESREAAGLLIQGHVPGNLHFQ